MINVIARFAFLCGHFSSYTSFSFLFFFSVDELLIGVSMGCLLFLPDADFTCKVGDSLTEIGLVELSIVARTNIVGLFYFIFFFHENYSNNVNRYQV